VVSKLTIEKEIYTVEKETETVEKETTNKLITTTAMPLTHTDVHWLADPANGTFSATDTAKCP